MKLSEFDFNLPPELIAQHPPAVRGESRLLACPNGKPFQDLQFSAIVSLLQAGDVLVVNDTQVVKARLSGRKATGGVVEVMVERQLDAWRFTAMIRASKAPKPNSIIHLPGNVDVRVLAKHDMLVELEMLPQGDTTEPPCLLTLLETHGQLPLPPYIEHTADAQDEQRYQTVYAKEPGAVAAPTAGLHFTQNLLEQLKAQGVSIHTLTLHVGAGTFLPVKTEDVSQHTMHSERYHVPGDLIQAMCQAKAKGKRVVAVGTTSLRALEAWCSECDINLNGPAGLNKALNMAAHGHRGDTQIFIKPGHVFKSVDCLITNFHLPKSTLLMLVSAFAGKARIFDAYAHAIQQGYRFFSYGDAMWLENSTQHAD